MEISSLHAFARQYLPGGVCASARVNPALGHPFYVSRGDGPYVYDVEGRKYIDLCMSHGASLLGHNHPGIRAAVMQSLDLGVICSYETVYHSALAQRLVQMVPCAEMVRFAGSGTETVMHAVRLARAATGREKILKFEGHFHGYADDVFHSSAPPLDAAGPYDAPHTVSESAGIPAHMSDLVVVVPFNDRHALKSAFAQHGRELATLILEPINYDSGCILPEPGFLAFCRELCDHHDVVLFFDEVLTAFRMDPAGAQGYLGVIPDLCVLGKALGGGMPISAIAGKRDLMLHYRPVGDCEHSGTYLAHLSTVLGALAALDAYEAPGFYPRLNRLGARLAEGLQAIGDRHGVPLRVQYVGPRFGMYFGVTEPVIHYRQAAQQDREMLYTFIAACIHRGLYVHVSPHHGISSAHTDAEIDQALAIMDEAMAKVRDAHL